MVKKKETKKIEKPPKDIKSSKGSPKFKSVLTAIVKSGAKKPTPKKK